MLKNLINYDYITQSVSNIIVLLLIIVILLLFNQLLTSSNFFIYAIFVDYLIISLFINVESLAKAPSNLYF